MADETAALPTVLHLSGDFPDPIDSFKTPVIRSLLDLTASEFSHRVVSINRKSPSLPTLLADTVKGLGRPGLAVSSQQFDRGVALQYGAPGRGLFHATMLRQLGDWLAESIAQGERPDLLVGHKLAIEGIAIQRAASALNLPYALSIQGDTDTKILSARPDLTRTLAKAFHEADVVFPFSPWALKAVEAKLGRRQGPTILLPCPTDLDTPVMPTAGGEGLVTVFHLKNYKRKNLPAMVDAMKQLEAAGLSPKLTVVGGGNAQERQRCQSLANGLNGITFAGPQDRAAVRQTMARAKGFVMPSLRESFGLVFIEALFAGLPIIYPAGTAVDGFLDGLPFALRVDARDPAALAAAMRKLIEDEQPLKAALAHWLASDECRRFTRPDIGRQFARGLQIAMA
ncbi:MAG: hypothetical protein RIS85_1056 [Pseudomonadota bacterium]